MHNPEARPHEKPARGGWLRRTLKIFLTLAIWLLAIESVITLCRSSAGNFGFDFYLFWVNGDIVRHNAGLHPPALSIYGHDAEHTWGRRYLELARDKSFHQRQAAANWPTLETICSPFFYWVFSVLSPRDYDHALTVFGIVSLTSLLLAIVLLSWRLKFSIAGIGAAVALAALSAPVFSDFQVNNINCPQLLACAIYLLLRDRARKRGGSTMRFTLAGAALGLLIAFKPNLLLVAILLGFSGLFTRQWKSLIAESTGFFSAIALAVAICSWRLGGVSCWIDWLHITRELGSVPTKASAYGNFSLTRLIYEETGKNLVGIAAAISIAVATIAIWRGRTGISPAPSPLYSRERAGVRGDFGSCATRENPLSPQPLRTAAEARIVGSAPRTALAVRGETVRGADPTRVHPGESDARRDREFLYDLTIFAIGASITFLAAALAWVHYSILLFPFLLMLASPIFNKRLGLRSNLARYFILSAIVILFMIPLPPEVVELLPMKIKLPAGAFVHCAQAATLLALASGLWFALRVLPAMKT
jgi:hypothetical protein